MSSPTTRPPIPPSRTRRSIRWGLCCAFIDAPIRFRRATHRYVASLGPSAGRAYLSGIARDNALALQAAIRHCDALGIGAFRINSQILPLATHPVSGYGIADLDDAGAIIASLRAANALARRHDIRLSFHPDQFVVLNSEREDVVAASLRELEAQANIAELLGADTITLHGGGLAGGVAAATTRLRRGIDRLSERVRSRLALENDDRLFTIADLEPVSQATQIPLVFDVHHHRCHPAPLSIADATLQAIATWDSREPYLHISSPRDRQRTANPRPHADYIAPRDVPTEWMGRTLTVDVEAKAKDRAVVRIMQRIAGASP